MPLEPPEDSVWTFVLRGKRYRLGAASGLRGPDRRALIGRGALARGGDLLLDGVASGELALGLRVPAARVVEVALEYVHDAVQPRGQRRGLLLDDPVGGLPVDGLERCRVISLGSVGVDSVDVAAATARGIPVTNVPDTFIEEVADHAMTLILATFRRLITMDRMVREGRWREGRPLLYQFPRLMGQTLGFVAFGHVARAVAVRARPFGLRLIAYDPFVEELMMSRYGVEPVSLPELLVQADIISMHAPSTPSAHHMLREEHFRAMKRSALFVNTGRGPTVDEPALIKALQEGWIAGAGLA